jgi:ATP:ADP antiporter, AAA family
MVSPLELLRDPARRAKAALLSFWFFVTIANLWLLKPIRTASLLGHLGAAETPWVRLASVATVAVVVLQYSRWVDRASRLEVARGANVVCAALLAAFWIALQLFGEALGGSRAFVWAVYVLVDVYAVVIVGIFWTYANDVVSREEADALYGPVGFGGVVGGLVGGVFVDAFARPLGPENLLVPCALLSLVAAGLAVLTERLFNPPPRPVQVHRKDPGASSALEGLRAIKASHYLMLVVAIVVAYEFTATLTDFAINVVFEETYKDRGELAKMYGRLGWISSGTAVVAQAVLVPLVLSRKRLALSIPPFAMAVGAVGLLVAPGIAFAFVLGTADRGLNYSLQQMVKETLYVPLDDVQKYKAKAAIDMLIDRGGKAGAALVLLFVIANDGLSVRITVAIALVAILFWLAAALALGAIYVRTVEKHTQKDPATDGHVDDRVVDVPVASGERAVHVGDAAPEATGTSL